MTKYSRYRSVISRNNDEHISEDHWLKQFEKSLQKGAVQPRSPSSLYDQINSIMNGTSSKYPSVQAAVDDMMRRSGVSNYLKISKENDIIHNQKTATDRHNNLDKNIPVESKQEDTETPEVIKEKPVILQVLQERIKSTGGNYPVPAIIDYLRSTFHQDIGEEKKWDDDKLIRLVSKLNLEAKANNPKGFDNYSRLGLVGHDTAESDIDASNTDAFNCLHPAKI